MATRPRLIAHRGFGDRFPANTLAAFQGALTYADRLAGIEMDIQVTADGELVVLHDHQLPTEDGGRIDVSSLTVHELAAHPQVREECRGEPLPRLGEALAVIDHRTTVYLEIKESGLPPAAMLVPLRAALQDYGADDSVVLMSFGWRWMETAMAQLNLPVRYACLFTDAAQLAAIPAGVVAACTYMHPHAGALLAEPSYLARWPHLINPWTVNDRTTLNTLLAAPWADRLHGITTDDPDLLLP